MPIGSDQISTSAAVRHGTCTRPTSPSRATTDTTAGRSRSRYLGSSGPWASAAVSAMPQTATDSEASLDRSPVHSAYGAKTSAASSPIAISAGAQTQASAIASTRIGIGALATSRRERVSQPRTA